MISDSELPSELHKWAVTELFAVSKRVANAALMPSVKSLEKICRGRNKEIWLYLLQHVRSRASVFKIKNELQMYRNRTKDTTDASASKSAEVMNKLRCQLTALKSRKSFLEDQIFDLEFKLTLSSNEITEQKRKMREEENFLGLLLITIHTFDIKEMYFQQLARDLNLNVQKLKLTGSGQSDMTTQLTPSSLTVASVNHISNSDLEYIIYRIKEVFSLMSQTGSNSLHGVKKEIWEKIEQVLKNYTASDIITWLENQSKCEVDIIKQFSSKTEDQLTERSGTSQKTLLPLDNSLTSAELQRQKSLHIQKFMGVLKQKNIISDLSKQYECTVSDIKHQLGSYDIDSNVKEMQWELMQSEAKFHSLKASNETLKQIIHNISDETAQLQQTVTEEMAKTQEIFYYQSLIITKRNAMCEFLNQNAALISQLRERHGILCENAIHCIDSEKSSVEHGTAILKTHLETESKMRHIIKKAFLKKDFSTYRLHDSSASQELLKIFKVLPFQDENNIIQHCLRTLNNVTMVKELLEEQKKTMLDMESKKELLNLQQNTDSCEAAVRKQKRILNQASTMLSEGNEKLKTGEMSLLDIQQRLVDWWEQPAQYIHPIQHENRTLKEWIDLLTMLVKS